MRSSPGTSTDPVSSSGIRRNSLEICSRSTSSTTISPVLFANSTLTDLGRLCRIGGSSRTIASVEARSSFSATSSGGKWQRRQVISSSNFSGSTAELIDENERLRRENAQLNKELSQMKNLCNNICAMMSNHGGSDRSEEPYMTEENVKPLDLLPMTRFCEEMAAARCGGEGNSSMRRWGESEGTSVEHEMDLELRLPGGDVKYEPLDLDGESDDQE